MNGLSFHGSLQLRKVVHFFYASALTVYIFAACGIDRIYSRLITLRWTSMLEEILQCFRE